MIRSVIKGVGSALPERVMTNADISKIVDTSDEWITERTGIRARHIAGEGETTRSLAVMASRKALDHAGMRPNDIDMVIVATSTPDNTFPATATMVQADLGIQHGAAFDIQAVCTGFVYALTTADSLIKAGQAKAALVIGAETFSRILDWNDRTTCVLFGDGAGAFVLTAEEGEGANSDQGLLASKIRADGRYADKLYVDGGPSTTKTVGYLRMEGREVFKHAVNNIATVMDDVMRRAGTTANDIQWFVPHQANRRILEGVAKKLGVDESRFVMTVAYHGNTSAASIPLAFDVAVKDGRIERGQMVLMEAMGGGFTWGAALARY
ncbi:MAG: ketoacyl-ACP synthase III [Alphaproteobacteria bacterium]|nr:ketoacyl-ACP synthase III [Alphaproteobacteria bacterium]